MRPPVRVILAFAGFAVMAGCGGQPDAVAVTQTELAFPPLPPVSGMRARVTFGDGQPGGGRTGGDAPTCTAGESIPVRLELQFEEPMSVSDLPQPLSGVFANTSLTAAICVYQRADNVLSTDTSEGAALIAEGLNRPLSVSQINDGLRQTPFRGTVSKTTIEGSVVVPEEAGVYTVLIVMLDLGEIDLQRGNIITYRVGSSRLVVKDP